MNSEYKDYEVVDQHGNVVMNVSGYLSDITTLSLIDNPAYTLREKVIPLCENENTTDIDLGLMTDRDDVSFEEIAEFVDKVRKYNPNKKDSEIFIKRDENQSDHEYMTLVVPRNGTEIVDSSLK